MGFITFEDKIIEEKYGFKVVKQSNQGYPIYALVKKMVKIMIYYLILLTKNLF